MLTIAGSDSGGGAGIQADLKTFAAHGVHGLSVLTALTAQHTRGVLAVSATPPRMIAAQLDAVFDDFAIGALKIGMLGSRATVQAVARTLDRYPALPIVLDPVMVASSGAVLLAPDAIDALKDLLLPRALLLTPNVPEAELLSGERITRSAQLARVARALRALGPAAVLLKGGHIGRGPVCDVLVDAGGMETFHHPRLALDGHGTGCTLSAAIAANLARGLALRRAVAEATEYLQRALRCAYRPGRGSVSVLGHYAAGLRP